MIRLAIEQDKGQSKDFLQFLQKFPFLDNYSFIFNYYSPCVLGDPEAKSRYRVSCRWLPPDRKPLPLLLEQVDQEYL